MIGPRSSGTTSAIDALAITHIGRWINIVPLQYAMCDVATSHCIETPSYQQDTTTKKIFAIAMKSWGPL